MDSKLKPSIKPILFLVEGTNDKFVIINLLKKVRNDNLKVESAIGKNKVFSLLTTFLLSTEYEKIAIILDADTNFASKVQSVKNKLDKLGFIISNDVSFKGLITNQVTNNQVSRKIVGVWIMPDHESEGMLEDFLIKQIPENDAQKGHVNTFLDKLEALELNLYNKDLHRSKALIHCWLSVQKEPGKPFGQAIDKNLFDLDSNSRTSNLYHFLNWYDILEKIEIVEE